MRALSRGPGQGAGAHLAGVPTPAAHRRKFLVGQFLPVDVLDEQPQHARAAAGRHHGGHGRRALAQVHTHAGLRAAEGARLSALQRASNS